MNKHIVKHIGVVPKRVQSFQFFLGSAVFTSESGLAQKLSEKPSVDTAGALHLGVLQCGLVPVPVRQVLSVNLSSCVNR
jgi:hypothetical protein